MIVKSTDPQPADNHSFAIVFHSDGWKAPLWPLLVALISILIINCFSRLVLSCAGKILPMLIIGDLQIDEDIDNFWASLDDEDRNWSKKEEEYSREELGFKVLTDE